MAEEEYTDLLDELMSEIEGEEGEEEFVPASFAMDDLTVEVEQYGDDERLCSRCCLALKMISNNDANKRTLVLKGGLDVILKGESLDVR